MSDPNLDFYRGAMASRPHGALVDDIHKEWWGNFDLLEARRHHHHPVQGVSARTQPRAASSRRCTTATSSGSFPCLRTPA